MKWKLKRLLKDNNFRLGVATVLAAILVWLSFDPQVTNTFRDIWGAESQPSSAQQSPAQQAPALQSTAQQNPAVPASSTGADQNAALPGQQPTSQKGASEAESKDTAGLAVNQGEQKFNDLLVTASQDVSPEKFFAQYRLERDQARGRQVEWVQSVVNNAKTSEETRKEAQKKLLTLSDNYSAETQLENMLKAKNFKDALVFVKEDSVTVIVQASELSEQDVKRITDLVSRVTGKKAEEMVIIPKN